MPRAVRPWFRVYVEMFPDRKIRRLTPAQRWVWVAVMGAARESPEPGRLLIAEGVPMTVTELASYADVKEKDVTAALAAMSTLGMVTVDEVIAVTNWDVRQFETDNVTSRTRAFRERSNDVPTAPDGTSKRPPKERSNDVPGNGRRNAPDTDTDTDTDTEQLTTSVVARTTPFDEFWAAYPRRTGKRGAQAEWDRAVKRAPTERILAGARRYRDDANRDDAFTKHPSTWLHNDCWDDDPLPARGGTHRDAFADGLSLANRMAAAHQHEQPRELGA